ncbi:MAG: DUF1553 domain-containing protein [Planctomycetaceae bacterium]
MLEQWVNYLKEETGKPKFIFNTLVNLDETIQKAAAEKKARVNPKINAIYVDSLSASRASLLHKYKELFTEAETTWNTLKSNPETKNTETLPDAELEAFRSALQSDKGPFRIPENIEQAYSSETQQQLASWKAELKQINDSAPEPLQYAMGVTESDVNNMQVCIRGNHINLGPEVPRQFLSIVEGPEQKPLGDEQSGRLELAKWLTKPDHPLTSRVMANRIWRWHMGTGIVRTVDNFGLTGETPTHPELLDWLAVTFIEKGWSIKEMHRLIMNSSTYQMSSEYSPEYYELDPENKLYWRMNRQRLEAEAIRDAILAIAGTLDRTQVETTLKYKSFEYVNSTGGAGSVSYDWEYRSVYLPIIRSALFEMFQAYDFPDPSYMQGDRESTMLAPQSLFLMNSDFMEKQTAAMAKRLLEEAPDAPEDRIEQAYQLIFGRKPELTEMENSLAFLYQYETEVVKAIPEQESRALHVWKGLCRVLLSSNEFIFID